MSVRKKPEKAVPVLLDRLKKVMEKVVNHDDTNTHTMASRIHEIGSKLKLMDVSLLKIKEWEKKVVDKLCALEQAVYDAEGKPLEELKEQLDVIYEDVGKLESFICKVDESVILTDGGMSNEPKNQGQLDEVAPGETVSQNWAPLGAEDEMMESEATRSLWASIHCPESLHRRMCLLCLSVFPENTPIMKRPLIYWWMGEGLVSNEKEGEEVFQELRKEGFINNKLQLSPWVRLVLIALAQKIGFFKFSHLQGRMPRDGNRRGFLWQGVMNDSSAMDDHVLTVFNINEQYLGAKQLDWLRRLHKLEVLQMGRWQVSPTLFIEADNYEQLLDAALASKKHLKYLSLRGISRIETLPAPTIKKLVSLRILDMGACHNLEKLPHTISELRNLTHLDVSECYLLESMPKGIRHLLNLEVLKGFVVDTPGRSSCKIADLVGLTRLRNLSIRVRRQSGDQLKKLVGLRALCILAISWMRHVAPDTDTDVKVEVDVEVEVELPVSLTKLDLQSVPFKKVPKWLHPEKLPNLEKLRIRGGNLGNLDDLRTSFQLCNRRKPIVTRITQI